MEVNISAIIRYVSSISWRRNILLKHYWLERRYMTLCEGTVIMRS
jgi:hypothetical protein